MRKLSILFSALLLAGALSACDTTEDELSESEIFVGSWTVVEVSDNEGDKTDVFEQGIDEFSANIYADGTYDLTVDYADPQRPTVELDGAYTIEEGPNLLRLNATLGGNAVQLPFTYDIESENRIDLSINDALIEPVFGTQPETYVGTITFTVERQ